MRLLILGALATTLAAGSAGAQNFSSCAAGLKAAAIRSGVSPSVASVLDKVQADEKVLRLSKVQPEFKTPIWDYFGFLIDDERVAKGRAMMQKYDRVLRAAEQRFGVDRYVVAAVWGVETDFGGEVGDSFLPQALATLTCQGGRREKFWRGELIAALKLVDRGDLRMNELYGSWAGAFGQTQFIPSTYERLAVDFDGDGRRDLVSSVPDALGSTANYLRRGGWQTGQPWMIEVKAPSGYKGPTGRKAKGLARHLGPARHHPRRRRPPLRRRVRGPAAAGGPQRARLPRLQELRRDLFLQPGGILRPGDLLPGRPHGGLPGPAHAVADRRSRPVAGPAPAIAEVAAGAGLRHR